MTQIHSISGNEVMYPKKLNITRYQQQTIKHTVLKGCQMLQQKVSNT